MARHTFRFKFVNQLGNTSGGRTNAELILGIVNVSAGNIVPGTQRRIVRTAEGLLPGFGGSDCVRQAAMSFGRASCS
jgi:hypothetical protein